MEAGTGSFGFGFGLSLKASLLSSAGAAPIVMTPYSILDDFETTTAWTPSAAGVKSSSTGSRKVLHTAGMRIQGIGTNAAVNATRTGISSADPAAWNVIALCLDCGTDAAAMNINSLKLSWVAGGVTYNQQVDAANGGVLDGPFLQNTVGKKWLSFSAASFRQTSWAGAQLIASGAISKNLTLNCTATAALDPDYVIDALILPDVSAHKSIIMMTFDDNHAEQYLDFYPIMAARGLVATCYLPYNLLGSGIRGGSMNLTQLQALKAAGWAICLDSDPDDKPFTTYNTVAASVAQFQASQAQLITDFGDVEASKHCCSSYGNVAFQPTVQALSTVSNGTTTVTISAASAFTFLAPGLEVHGTNVPANTQVVSVVSPTSVVLNNAIPAQTATLRYIGRLRGIASTCNGTTTITVADTSDFVDGMTMTGYTVPAGTTVTVASATTLTASAAVPATCVIANYDLKSREFWGTNLSNALLAAGVHSLRRNSGVGGPFTAYGIDPLVAIDMNSHSLDSANGTATTTAITKLDAAIAAHQDLMHYQHGNSDLTQFTAWCDALQTRVNAGLCEVLTVPAWYTKVSARLPIS